MSNIYVHYANKLCTKGFFFCLIPKKLKISDFFCGGVCGGVCVCVCLAYTSEDFHMKTLRHTEDSTPSEDSKTGPRKTLAKNAENVMFYHLRGVRAPRTSMDFQPYLIYEDIRVLGSISKASRGVCVCVKLVDFPNVFDKNKQPYVFQEKAI